jgi:flagellar biosynthesis/type III secretory pathway protein FliH
LRTVGNPTGVKFSGGWYKKVTKPSNITPKVKVPKVSASVVVARAEGHGKGFKDGHAVGVKEGRATGVEEGKLSEFLKPSVIPHAWHTKHPEGSVMERFLSLTESFDDSIQDAFLVQFEEEIAGAQAEGFAVGHDEGFSEGFRAGLIAGFESGISI